MRFFRERFFLSDPPVEAPFGAFVRIITDSVADSNRPESLVEAVSVFKLLVAPQFDRSLARFRSFQPDGLGESLTEIVSAGQWPEVEPL